MKVKELIEILSKCNPDADVVLSRDEEGNGYGSLSDVSLEFNWDGEYNAEIGLKELTPDLIKAGYEEEDTMPDGYDCVVLWP